MPEQETIDFDGSTFDQQMDGKRLRFQLDSVLRYLLKHDGWHSLRGLSDAMGFPEASISARLRDLRKTKHGGYEVARRRIGCSGTWQYRLGMKLSAKPQTGE